MRLNVAVNAALAVERIGLPEGQIPLAQAVALRGGGAKKQRGLLRDQQRQWRRFVISRRFRCRRIYRDQPLRRCREAGTWRMAIEYAHDYPNHYVKQQYLPDELAGETFYVPTDNGYERRIREHMERIRREAEE